MQRPLTGEYNPYFQRYIDMVGEGAFFEIFEQTTHETTAFFAQIPAEKHNYRYAENKWTIKDVFMHVIDTERVMAYRALVVARGDSTTELPYMDENGYAENIDVTNRSMENMLEEFRAIRTSTRLFLENLTEEQTQRVGKANGHAVTPRALAYIVVGHILHHLKVLEERYLA